MQIRRHPRPSVTRSALILAVPSAALGVALHLLAGGAVTFLILVAAAVPAVAAGFLLASKGELKLPMIVATLALGQFVLHEVAALCGAHHSSGHADGARMFGAHVVTTLVVAALVRREEARAWLYAKLCALMLAISRLMSAAVCIGVRLVDEPAAIVAEPVRVLRQLADVAAVGRRGPPVLV